MPAPTSGLARVTIRAPRRRLDLAIPHQVPLAELLPEVLRRAGEAGPELDGSAAPAGGWILRRGDGGSLHGATALAHQGVRDGDVLYLVPRNMTWPEPEYDDVIEEIAASAKQHGRTWDAAATRTVLARRGGTGAADRPRRAGRGRTGSDRAGAGRSRRRGRSAGVGALLSRALGDGVAGAAAGGIRTALRGCGRCALRRRRPGDLAARSGPAAGRRLCAAAGLSGRCGRGRPRAAGLRGRGDRRRGRRWSAPSRLRRARAGRRRHPGRGPRRRHRACATARGTAGQAAASGRVLVGRSHRGRAPTGPARSAGRGRTGGRDAGGLAARHLDRRVGCVAVLSRDRGDRRSAAGWPGIWRAAVAGPAVSERGGAAADARRWTDRLGADRRRRGRLGHVGHSTHRRRARRPGRRRAARHGRYGAPATRRRRRRTWVGLPTSSTSPRSSRWPRSPAPSSTSTPGSEASPADVAQLLEPGPRRLD